jgi:hypothetical protein
MLASPSGNGTASADDLVAQLWVVVDLDEKGRIDAQETSLASVL